MSNHATPAGALGRTRSVPGPRLRGRTPRQRPAHRRCQATPSRQTRPRPATPMSQVRARPKATPAAATAVSTALRKRSRRQEQQFPAWMAPTTGLARRTAPAVAGMALAVPLSMNTASRRRKAGHPQGRPGWRAGRDGTARHAPAPCACRPGAQAQPTSSITSVATKHAQQRAASKVGTTMPAPRPHQGRAFRARPRCGCAVPHHRQAGAHDWCAMLSWLEAR